MCRIYPSDLTSSAQEPLQVICTGSFSSLFLAAKHQYELFGLNKSTELLTGKEQPRFEAGFSGNSFGVKRRNNLRATLVTVQ